MSRHGRLGATLLELLVVLLIMGISAAVVAPALPRSSESGSPDELETEVRQLLHRARMTALERGESVTLRVEPAGHGYSIETERSLTRLVEGTFSVPDGMQVRIGSGALTYDPTGGAVGGPLSIIATAGLRTLVIDPWAGRAVRAP